MSRSLATATFEFDSSLSQQEREVILEEQSILETVLGEMATAAPPGAPPNFDDDLLELRDSLADATLDETAQIVAQMDGLASLSNSLRAERAQKPLNSSSPYFGHLRVEQGGRELHVLIGTGTHIPREAAYPIIDWRNAPISRLYYSYGEGEMYEEEFGGKLVEGTILAHRRLMILQGRLLRVECIQGTYQFSGNRWVKFDKAAPTLQGGEGSAVRPGTLETLRLGVEHLGMDVTLADGDAENRLLRAITGMLDPEQFELITKPDSGILVIDGGAGSGKTTIALHRIAYLCHLAPERFQPSNMMTVVFGKALATYISALLPALGVEKARIEVLEDFAGRLRRRHFPKLKGETSEITPFTVVRFKQHPAALKLLEENIAETAREFRNQIKALTESTASAKKALEAWDSLEQSPLAFRLAEYAHWVAGRAILPGIGGFGKDWLAQGRLADAVRELLPNVRKPEALVTAMWEEAFIRLERLREATERHCPGEFSEAQLEEIRDWCQRGYSGREEYRAQREEWREQPGPAEEGEAHPAELPELDQEDDILLLLLFGMLVGPLRNRRNRPLRVQHLMIDEAQDFSPLDIKLMIGLAEEPRSVTLAGDTDQRMILHNAFDTWEDVLRNLGLEGTPVSPLKVGYRSTEEIMEFSKGVLGPLSTGRPWIATRKGAPVELLRFTDPGQAVGVLSEALLALLRREPNAYVALIARYPEQADVYYEGLAFTGLTRLRRVADQGFSFQRGIDVTDVQQVKGLEFDYVVLLDVDRASYPDDTASRYLLHIAATRAAHQLWLVACNPPSPLLPSHLTQQIV